MRVLGIDFGGKRIGVAIGETEHKVATPRPQIEATGTLRLDAANIFALVTKEEAKAVVIGTPTVGTEETKMSRICRMLGAEIEKLGGKVEYVDESLTSVRAEEALKNQQWTASTVKKHLDSEAACQILERYFGG
ncbi:MAG: Holliday junction resolvase RuvX [Armatimonadota bacterium]